MADLATLERALRNADKAGDEPAAKRFAAEIQKMRSQPDQPAKPGVLRSMTEGARDIMTSGFGDELMAVPFGLIEAGKRTVTGEDSGKGVWPRLRDAYSFALDRERQTMKDAQEANPVAYTAGQIGGGLGLGAGAAKRGLTLLHGAKPTMASLAGRGAAEGAIYGGAYGAGSGEGLRDRAIRTATGAAAGGAIGALGGAISARSANKAAMETIPTAEQLKAAGSANYKLAESAGLSVKPASFKQAVDDITQTAITAGVDKTIHPKATAALVRLQDAVGKPKSLKEIDTLRRVTRAAAGSTDADERRIASIMIDKIDDYLVNLKPADISAGDEKLATKAITHARALWARGRKGEIINDLVDRAKTSAPNFSGSGYENALRTEFRSLAKNKTRMRQFSQLEQNAIKRVARGGPVENILRMVGKFAPTGVVSGVLSGGAGAAIGGPAGAIALPVAGFAARQGATALTARNVSLADALIRSGGKLPAARLTGSNRGLLEALLSTAPQQAAGVLRAR